MGRTVTPFSIVLSQEETRLKKFRRALRAEDRKHFDELFEHARRNIQAAVQAAAPEPMESIFLLMLIEMQKEIQELKARVGETRLEDQFALVAPNEETKD
ncbi:MAG: hypothetical protein L0Y75_06335 [Acidobacteria bacterium]|nr:hypothetical protein [Acidobacteriota bacterium]